MEPLIKISGLVAFEPLIQKKRRRDITKKMSAPCNFCEFSSSRYESGSEHNEEAVLREKVERLQFLIKRMSGRDDDASFTELEALISHLEDVMRIVRAQKDKIKPEKDELVADGPRRGVLVPSTTISEKRQQRQDDPLLKWKRPPDSESLQSKFKRLYLFNERMNGREIESMTSYEDLILLETQMFYALVGLRNQMMEPVQIARLCGEMNPKRRRRDVTKKVRVLCDFCGLSSSNRCEQSPNKQEDESLSMESELKRLRLLTRRMTGKDIDGLSFTELHSLETNHRKALLIVENQREKTELEEAERKKRKQSLRPLKQKREAWDKDEATMTSSGEKRDDEVPPLQSRRRIEYERLSSESMQSQFERLWLLKERMSGRELGNMTSSALLQVIIQIRYGLMNMSSPLPI